jgi:RNA polymerase sigma-70 factor (ECF subfamily)
MSAEISDLDRRREFDALVREFRPDLFRYAFWLSRSRNLADDVVQEALLRAWKSYSDLKDRDSARQWLVTIVRREHARVYERKQLDTVDIASFEEEIAASESDPDLQRMRRALFQLDDGYREPLALQVLLGHTVREIGGLLGLPEATVLTRLHRARNKLKQALGSGPEVAGGQGDSG